MTGMMDAFYLCLLASLIWAPIVFLTANALEKRTGGAARAIWPIALVASALPVLAAPIAAALGLSLRTSKPLPPMSALPQVGPEIAAPATITAIEPVSTVNLAMIVDSIASLYFYGFVLFAALGIVRLVGFSYRVRYSYAIDDADLRAGLEDWRLRMGVTRRARFAYSDAVSSVCVHGFIRPVVLMPPQLLEHMSTRDAILMGAHELAHVRRGDTWLFAFCAFIKALFWFNPFIRRIIAHAQLTAEQSADALVIRAGVSRRDYAQCFVQSLKAASGLAAPRYELAPSFTPFDKRSRRERLDAILSGNVNASHLSPVAKGALVLSGIAAITLAFGQAALAVAPPAAQDALSVIPVEGRITSTFGERHDPFTKELKYHQGIDIAAPTGTPVKAAGDGKVIDATGRYQGNAAWGNVVVIDHGHGLVTRYAQLDSFIVRKGDKVKAGDAIGAVGATGRATGPHLHFEVILDGENIDPQPVAAPLAPLSPRTTRKVMISPAALTPAPVVATPGIAPVVKPAPAPHAVIRPEPVLAPTTPPSPERLSLGDRLELRLAGKSEEWARYAESKIENFTSLKDLAVLEEMAVLEDLAILENLGEFSISFDEIDLEGFEGADELAQALNGKTFTLDDVDVLVTEMPKFAFLWDGDELSDEQRREIEKAKAEAERQIERANRDAERELRRTERKMERSMQRSERERKRMLREVERTERERERVMRAIDDRDLEMLRRDDADVAVEMLAEREETLREAAAELAREREELERLRAEIEAQNDRD